MPTVNRLIFIIFSFTIVFFLPGCGGGGGGAENELGVVVDYPFTTLAKDPHGGIISLSLSNDRLYFPRQSDGEIQSVGINGGEIITHYSQTSIGTNDPVNVNGKTYFLNGQTRGAVHSIPGDAIGVATLSEKRMEPVRDIANDDTYSYWIEGSTLFRTPIIQTADSQVLDGGHSKDILFKGETGDYLQMVLDGKLIYISEAVSGDIYRVSTETRAIDKITTLPYLEGLNYVVNWIQLVVTESKLYALVDNNHIYCMDKDGLNQYLVASNYMKHGKLRSDKSGVYWWEGQPPSLVLKKHQSITNEISTVTTIPFISDPYFSAFISDGTSVFWFTETLTNAGYRQVEVHSVPTSGGTPSLVSTFDAYLATNGGMVPNYLAVDETDFYWTSQAVNALITMPKTGGTPSLVTMAISYSSTKFSLYQNYILLSDSKGIRKLLKAGQATLANEWSAPDTHSQPRDLVSDGTSIFWTVMHYATRAEPWSTSDVFSMGISSGFIQLIATVPNQVDRIFPYKDSLYLTKASSSGGEISKISKYGGVEDQILDLQGRPTDTFIFNDVMYFLDGTLSSLNLITNKLNVIDDYLPFGQSLFVDSEHVYWTEIGPFGTGGAYRIRKGSDKTEVLIFDKHCFRIIGDLNNIYVTSGWKIMKFAK